MKSEYILDNLKVHHRGNTGRTCKPIPVSFPANQKLLRNTTPTLFCCPKPLSLEAGMFNRDGGGSPFFLGKRGEATNATLRASYCPRKAAPAHSWVTLIICSMCLNNSLAFFTWQPGSRCPMGRRQPREAPHCGLTGGAAPASTFDLVPLDDPAAVSKP